MGKIDITFISDTHTKHKFIQKDLEGGDLLIHCGDIMGSGYDVGELELFLDWFNGMYQYEHKVFIAGNHDRYLQDEPTVSKKIIEFYPNITYLQDSSLFYAKSIDEGVSIWGSPWQPEFYNWAFNLPRNGKELEDKWNEIPDDTDILITHGPPQGVLDTAGPPYNTPLLGCEKLIKRVKNIKPKIHVFGHIHGGYGYYFDGNTHFINASVLNERYEYTNKPLSLSWDVDSNKIEFDI